MNKPLLQPPGRRFQRLTRREFLFGLIALGCAAGWYYDRRENRPSPDVLFIMDAMKEVQRDPQARVRVSVNFKGKYPIVCDLSRLGAPPAK